MNGFMGKDGFAWFFGVVEDRMDPLEIGRVKVRALGFHDENKNKLPTSGLPWATVVQPSTSSNFSGKGFSSVGLLEGTWVLGFFTDPNSYQVPVIIGGINGLNATSVTQLHENYGSAFKDIRTPQELLNYPTDQVVRKYPDGMTSAGDGHGAQLQNTPLTTNFPNASYGAKATKSKTGTPDTNILGMNDTTRIKDTIVDLKTKSRLEGGLRDENIPVADIWFPKFVTGVIGLTGANLGTVKGLGLPPNGVTSSSSSSAKLTSNQFISSPTNSNAEKIHTGIKPSDTVKMIQNGVSSFKGTLSMGSEAMSNIKNSMNSVTNFPNSVVGETMGSITGSK